jgi:hypothetical protein
MITLFILGFLATLLAVVSGTHAVSYSPGNRENIARDEFVVRQLTAGAWACGCVAVVAFAGAAWLEAGLPLGEPSAAPVVPLSAPAGGH